MNLQALLALFSRSVKEDTRSKALLWARIGIAGAVLFAILRARASSFIGGAPGLAFFSSVVWMNFVFICVAGMSYFASSITEEKEEGTLGMLRMTDLSPVAILLGKSTSRLIGGMLLLLVQVPFVMLAITLGGTRIDQVLSCYALLGAFLFFACNVGLLASVLCHRTGAAAVVAAIFAIAYLCWPMIPAQIPSPLQQQFEALVPTFSTPMLLEEILRNRGVPLPVAGGFMALVGGGIAAFVTAWLLFDRFSAEESVRAHSPRYSESDSAQGLLRPRPSRAWDDAICWRDFHYLHGGVRLAWAKGVVYFGAAAWLAVELLESRWMNREHALIRYFSTLFIASTAVAVFESLFATSRIYRLERKQRTFSSLAIIPLYDGALQRSKRRAVWLSLIPSLVFVAISFLGVLGPFLRDMSGTVFVWAVQGLGYFAAQLYFNHALVAWFSLRMKWGGLPLALGISWLGNTVAVFFAVLMFHIASLFVLIIVTLLAGVAMQSAFQRRLEIVATED